LNWTQIPIRILIIIHEASLLSIAISRLVQCKVGVVVLCRAVAVSGQSEKHLKHLPKYLNSLHRHNKQQRQQQS